MNLKIFLENFDTIAQAPKGIPKLRSLILDLAVRGKLVPQNPEDEPAEKLINKNQKLIIKENKGKIKSIPTLQNTEGSIPKGWRRCQLADIALVVMGNSPPGSSYNKSGQGVPLINGPVEFSPGAFGLTIRIQYTTAPSRICKQGDLLVCVRGATTGRTNIAAFDACVGRGVALIRGWEAQNYLNYLLWHVGEQLLQQGKGTTFPSISYSDLAGLEVLFPPLAEQKRIVEKVDELMALCDRLQQSQETRDNLRQKLRGSAIDALMSAETDEELKQSWAIVRDNWHTLSQKPEDVGDLRRSVLYLSIRGNLVPQINHDEPAEKLLKVISTKHSIDEKRFRKPKDLLPIESVDKPFEIPSRWCWCRFTDIGILERGKSKHRPRNEPTLYENGSIPLVQTGDVARAKGVVTTYTALYNENGLAQSRLWSKGTLCITIAANIGDSAILGFDACFPDSVVGFLPTTPIEDSRYFEFFLRTLKSSLENFAPSTAQKNINLAILDEVLIPLPPLAEQKRIVAKVDELMQICDRLEESLRQSQQRAEALAASAISHLEI